MRLYSDPISVSTNALTRNPVTTSTVRPQIEILDSPNAALNAPNYRREPHAKTAPHRRGFADMFDQPRSAAAELFS
jgi:hypothetical protein